LALRGELTLMTSLALVIPVAALSWFLIEKPALRFKRGSRSETVQQD
jgi:peptidoglycan/LPS O-acetylase OafA/YrhL